MIANRKRGISAYKSVAMPTAETRDPHELIQLLFVGLTDRIAAARALLGAQRHRTVARLL